MIGESYFEQSRRAELDQTETHEAISAYRQFIEDNPSSPHVDKARERIQTCRERLAKKQYLAARLYQRQGYLKAARMTYEQLLRNYPLTSWYWEGLAQLGNVARDEGNVDEARSHYQEVLKGAKDDELLEDVRASLAGLVDGE
jgi:outer membrane protein assembly factor BamD